MTLKELKEILEGIPTEYINSKIVIEDSDGYELDIETINIDVGYNKVIIESKTNQF